MDLVQTVWGRVDVVKTDLMKNGSGTNRSDQEEQFELMAEWHNTMG